MLLSTEALYEDNCFQKYDTHPLVPSVWIIYQPTIGISDVDIWWLFVQVSSPLKQSAEWMPLSATSEQQFMNTWYIYWHIFINKRCRVLMSKEMIRAPAFREHYVVQSLHWQVELDDIHPEDVVLGEKSRLLCNGRLCQHNSDRTGLRRLFHSLIAQHSTGNLPAVRAVHGAVSCLWNPWKFLPVMRALNAWQITYNPMQVRSSAIFFESDNYTVGTSWQTCLTPVPLTVLQPPSHDRVAV